MTDEVKVVVSKEPGLKKTTELETPRSIPDVTLVPMPWWARMLVRAGRVYLQTLSGLWTGAQFGVPGLAAFDQLVPLLVASLMPAIYSLILNGVELLTSLDQSHPQLRA